MSLILWGGVIMLCELLLSMSLLSCQRELELQPTPGQDVSTSLTGEIVFTVADANAELLTKSSPAEEKSTISYGMIRPRDGEGQHIANITMESEPLELPAWGNDTQTKADVTGLSSFYVTCVTGSAGSESQSWGNVGFSGSSTFSGGKYWPSSNLGYKFYASNASMSFASGGTTVTASNSTDVVVAYKTDATYYASSNPLSFSHIFGKVGSVTVSPAEGFDSSDITDISITIIPKTGGTYNIRTGSWSSVSSGSATAIANSTPGTKSNDLYLVPDTYTITASWNARGMEFDGSGEFTVSAGECKNFTITLGGQVIVFSVSETEKVNFAPGNLQAVIGGGPIGGYIYTASEWHFAEHQYDYIGNAAGNNSFAIGTTVDLFGWVGASAGYDSYGLCTLGTSQRLNYGDNSRDTLKTDWGSILGVVSSYGAGWRTLTYDEWVYLFRGRTNASSLYGQCQITTASKTVTGMLILPDNWTKPSNCTVTPGDGAFDRVTYSATAVSGASNAWCDMEAAGAVFLPAAGMRMGKMMLNVGSYGSYWSSSVNRAYCFNSGSLVSSSFERYYGLSVRLVRDFN